MKMLIKQQRNSGFFSDFNLIVSSLLYLYKNNISEYNFWWNNWRYQESPKINLFDIIFSEQPIIDNPDKITTVEEFDTIWKPIMEKSIYIELNKVLSHFQYFKNALYLNKISIAKNKIKSNCLGVHARFTDATIHRPHIPIQYYFDTVEAYVKQNNNIKSLFVATDDQKILEQFIKRYGIDTVQYNHNIIRSLDGQAIHADLYNPNKHQLMEDVILDGICMSLCDTLIHTASNVAGYCFTLNPNLNSVQIDKHLPHF
jgi:hypothetical protein